eukprot:CAMPEP_0177536326 /NCGR_PEP_ID=MMETSP0369-20130122/57108_1 /TAXON_ID=447022 ORGANISM="Scrippsiella hangoei-like, Strain SHHI-4" /NCGR_SAMPLE_ID=MMETSP0369 /ASSEMBLY_ACC=CAM_ASM_000364 /LENGTH=139 /DNA_ID=CAMNT_0019018711 /DNA_START=70 /DNA_END=486 /DNA_ORIENTATION=+
MPQKDKVTVGCLQTFRIRFAILTHVGDCPVIPSPGTDSGSTTELPRMTMANAGDDTVDQHVLVNSQLGVEDLVQDKVTSIPIGTACNITVASAMTAIVNRAERLHEDHLEDCEANSKVESHMRRTTTKGIMKYAQAVLP